MLPRVEAFGHAAADEVEQWPTTRRDGMDPQVRQRLERLVAEHQGPAG